MNIEVVPSTKLAVLTTGTYFMLRQFHRVAIRRFYAFICLAGIVGRVLTR